MKKVVVSDTNIFIDLINIGLIKSLFLCGLEIHTTAMVIDEIKKEYQKKELLKYKELVIRKYQEKDYEIVFNYYSAVSRSSNLSMTDCSTLLYARELNCTLLTNDGKLRKAAIEEGIEVKRLLSVIMYMVKAKAVTKTEAKTTMEQLKETNCRAPMELIAKFIKELAEDDMK